MHFIEFLRRAHFDKIGGFNGIDKSERVPLLEIYSPVELADL